ncbi:helix-turn-helix transcriptional regulator [Microbispora sp. ZYX-F-249]|uniref:Helix-turn-helix transcriptional regulator n=1 Tax=Microbispora maris TaxID=3144104 RepID=A0ABV0AL98_9ACTN
MARTNPTLRRRQLASRLREMRRSSGMTVEQVAQELLCSPAKISRMETGQRGASQRDVRDLCRIYGVTGERTISELMTLAREARMPGLRQEYGDLGGNLNTYLDFEDAAAKIYEFQTAFIPSLLQTEEYARALIRGMRPLISSEMLDRRVDARIKRQGKLLESEPPTYWALMDEAALLRRVGTAETMRAQLDRVLELADLPHVTVQVIPFRGGAYMCSDNPFVFLQTRDPTAPRVVYLELLTRGEYLEKPEELTVYEEALDRIRAAALSPQESTDRITLARDDFANQVTGRT